MLKEIASIKEAEEITELVDKHFRFFVVGLIELPIYQNKKLLNSSLKILRTMFEQRKDLIENFKRILICGKGNLQEVYLTLKFMRGKFENLNDQNIMNYTGDDDPHFS